MILKNISKKVSQKNQNFPVKIGYNSGCNMKYTWLLKVEYLLNGCLDLYEREMSSEISGGTKCLNTYVCVYAPFARVSCTDLYEKLFGSQYLSHELRFQIL